MTDLTAAETKYFETKGAEPIPEPDTKPDISSDPPAPEATPDIAKPAASEPAKEADKPPPGHVNKGALDEERNRRRQAEKERQTLAEQLAELKGKMSAIEQLGKPAQTKPEIPAFDQDPARNLDSRLSAQEQAAAEIRQWREKQAQDEQVAQQRNQFIQVYAQQAEVFKKDAPDFPQAYKHLLEAKAAELEAAGIDDPQERGNTLHQWEAWIVEQAMKRGRNPAGALYEMSKRAGYAAKAAEETKAVPDRDETGKFKKAESKLEQVTEGLTKAKSVGAVSGSGAEGAPKLEALLNMDDDDFEKTTAGKNWKKFWN